MGFLSVSHVSSTPFSTKSTVSNELLPDFPSTGYVFNKVTWNYTAKNWKQQAEDGMQPTNRHKRLTTSFWEMRLKILRHLSFSRYFLFHSRNSGDSPILPPFPQCQAVHWSSVSSSHFQCRRACDFSLLRWFLSAILYWTVRFFGCCYNLFYPFWILNYVP